MTRKRGSRKSQVDSGSESEEVGIYNVERIVAKKIDPKVKIIIFNSSNNLIFNLGKSFLFN